MPANDSPAYLVARFLKTNNYEKTLDAFITEANLPPDAGSLPTKDALTLERILEEKRAFDKSLHYTKQGEEKEENEVSWTSSPAPSVPHVVTSISQAANVLHVGVDSLLVQDEVRPVLLASTADRKVSMLAADQPSLDHLGSLPPTPVDSPVLSWAAIDQERVVVTAMSGLVSLYNLKTLQRSERRDHKKFVVKVAVHKEDGCVWLATAGWDAKVFVYRITSEALGSPMATASLPTIPETLLFARNPDTDRVYLIVSRRDSSRIYYYLLNTEQTNAGGAARDPDGVLTLAGSQSLAPHSNAWVAFSPSSMALSPRDSSLLAVATSSLPHMRLIIIRLLFPPIDSNDTQPVYSTQAAQERAALAKEDREEAAIKVNISTMAPQTHYSTPQLCWRPDGSGIFVNGDDGVIRGVEVKTGKIVSILKDGHEPDSRIRSIWAGQVGNDGQEWLVTGGFDKKLVVWRPT